MGSGQAGRAASAELQEVSWGQVALMQEEVSEVAVAVAVAVVVAAAAFTGSITRNPPVSF